MAQPSAPHRFVLLDGLRGLAAIGILAFHVARDGSPVWVLDPLYLLVDFFFVLSGFVLLPSLPRTFSNFGRESFIFIVKRIFRLWPMVVSVIAFSALAYHFTVWDTHRQGNGFNYDVTRNTHNYIAALLLLQMWVPKALLLVTPLWSLSAEWFANIAYIPLAPIKRTLGIVAGILAGYYLFHQGLNHDTKWIEFVGPIRGKEAFGRAMIGFGFGLIMRMIADRTNRWMTNPAWLIISLWLVWWLYNQHSDRGYNTIYFAAPVFALLVLQASQVSISHESLLGKLMLKLGAWSFGIYAFHRIVMDLWNYVTAAPLHWYSTPIYMAPNKVWHRYMWEKGITVTLISVALTIATAKFIEGPLQRRGEKLVQRINAPSK